ncbi:hypothetical protein LP420_22005 [Massilia sp. B-10]|nr:hypothetical protein LP420_22005 [Massilia sp. B-10]
MAQELVDRARHADAFANADQLENNPLPSLVARLGIESILDVGCGALGQLLVRLAVEQPDFRAWGLEANPRMRALAKAGARAAQVGGRVRILADDGRQVSAHLDQRIRNKLQAVVAVQFVNELFGQGEQAATDWLRMLRDCLPGLLLIVSDYYSLARLHAARSAAPDPGARPRAAAVRPGRSPADARLDPDLPACLGVRLIHAIEDVSSTRYIHILAL